MLKVYKKKKKKKSCSIYFILFFFFFLVVYFCFVIVWSDIKVWEKQISQQLIRAYDIAMLLSCVLRPKALLPRRSKLLPIFQEGEVTSPLISGPAWTLKLQFTKYYQSYAPMIFFFVIPLTDYIRSTELYRSQFCATSYYLPRAYNAPLCGALVFFLFFFFFFFFFFFQNGYKKKPYLRLYIRLFVKNKLNICLIMLRSCNLPIQLSNEIGL